MTAPSVWNESYVCQSRQSDSPNGQMSKAGLAKPLINLMYQLRQKTDLETPQIVPTVHAIMGGPAASNFSRLVYNFCRFA